MKMFNITPKPRMLLGVQSQRWTVSGALAELLDNAFGPGRGNATTVKITFDPIGRTMSVTDDGRGMEYIGRLFQLGNTIGRTAGDIGHFGSGGTQAIIWLAEWVSVATERKGKIMADRIRWPEIFELEDFRDVAVSNEWKEGGFAQYSEFLCGTAIHLKLLKTRKVNVGNVIRDLSRLFAPGLRGGKKIIFQQGDDAQYLSDPFEIKASPENIIRFNVVVVYEEKHLPVHGVISFDDSTSHADSVVRVGLSYREIMRTRDCFKSEKESFAGVGVSGWLDLGDGWQEYLTTTKDGFDNQPIYEALMTHVFEKIRELLLRADQRTVDFELDNIAVGLQVALQKTMQMKVTVTRDRGTGPSGDEEVDERGDEYKKRVRNPSTEKHDATAHIRLIPQLDGQMMGALARSGSDPQGIYVDINQDHTYVCEAMRQRPVNSAALNLMIITEIATLLTTDSSLLKMAFRKSLIEELDRRDGAEKTRMLVRHLIDGVPNKHQAAAE